ncbi:hypothetical protein Tco_1294663, partial [Tanacetum coccineum]
VSDFVAAHISLKGIDLHTEECHHDARRIQRKALPTPSFVPKKYYEAKTYIRDLGFKSEKIHACVNDCVLYRTKYKSLTHCPIPKCREPRFKGKDNNVPRKVLHYFPLIPRLQRLFIDPQFACDMRWHKEKRINDDNILRHPADTEPSSLTRGTIPLELVDASTVRSSQKRHGIDEYSSGDEEIDPTII